MYFYREDIPTLEEAYGLSTGRRFLADKAAEIGETLSNRPDFYRQFGPYWWAIKRLLRLHYPADGTPLWFFGGYRDRLMERHSYFRTASGRADIRTTWLAGFSYIAVETSLSEYAVAGEADEYLWEDDSGEARFLRLHDEDFPAQLDLFAEPVDTASRQATLDLDGDVCVYVPGTWYNHGNRCVERGQYHEAVACFKKYAALSRTVQERSQGWLCAGLAYDAAGHYAKAIACYRRCYRIEGAPWVLENIASSYERMGQLARAKKYYEEALSSMPGNPSVAHSLKSVTERLGLAL